ncbi:MAG: DUF2304 domain-containing protein [Planctomycetia bacterium]|nr:DUF2304 domain-containing protein [Planctomycetia bacterium]
MTLFQRLAIVGVVPGGVAAEPNSTMTLFQWLAITFLAGLLLLEIWEAIRGSAQRSVWWLRIAVWLTTAAAIARPEWVTSLATTLGIHRGADLVTYAAVLLLFITSLYFYARYLRLQHQITVLTRRMAILEARRPHDDETSEQKVQP